MTKRAKDACGGILPRLQIKPKRPLAGMIRQPCLSIRNAKPKRTRRRDRPATGGRT